MTKLQWVNFSSTVGEPVSLTQQYYRGEKVSFEASEARRYNRPEINVLLKRKFNNCV